MGYCKPNLLSRPLYSVNRLNLFTGKGSCSTVHVANSNFNQEQVVENIIAALKAIFKQMIRVIQSLHQLTKYLP